jgi:hypothetical protein
MEVDQAVELRVQVVDGNRRPRGLSRETRLLLETAVSGGRLSPVRPFVMAAGSRSGSVDVSVSTPGDYVFRVVSEADGGQSAGGGVVSGELRITVTRRAQALTLAQIPEQGLGVQRIDLQPASTSGLPVTLASATPEVCGIVDGRVRLQAVGLCTVTAAQDGDSRWMPAESASRSFMVRRPVMSLGQSRITAAGNASQWQISVSVEPASTGWQAVASVPWLTTTSTGTGPGTMVLTLSDNLTSASRTGLVTVGETTLTVVQEPSPSINLRIAEMVGQAVTFQWTYVGPRPVSFELEGGSSPGGVMAAFPVGDVGLQTVTVPQGRLYVRVRTAAGSAIPLVSNEVTFDAGSVEAPSAPSNLVGTAEGSRLVLNWTNTFDGGPLVGVRLLVSGAAETVLSLGRVSQFRFDGVPPGTYTFRIQPEGPSGLGTPSAAVTLTFPGSCQRPGMPSWFTVGRSDRRLTLRWEPSATGGAATDYEVLLNGVPVVTTGGAREVSGDVGPGTYALAIRAVNGCGLSEATPIQTVTVP